MAIPPTLRFLLVLGVVLVVPLTVGAFLLGGDVTPEQGLIHAASIAKVGEHSHGMVSRAGRGDQGTAPSRPVSDNVLTALPVAVVGASLAGPPLTPANTAWLALVIPLLMLRALAARRLGWGRTEPAPCGFIPALASPPPRSST